MAAGLSLNTVRNTNGRWFISGLKDYVHVEMYEGLSRLSVECLGNNSAVIGSEFGSALAILSCYRIRVWISSGNIQLLSYQSLDQLCQYSAVIGSELGSALVILCCYGIRVGISSGNTLILCSYWFTIGISSGNNSAVIGSEFGSALSILCCYCFTVIISSPWHSICSIAE